MLTTPPTVLFERFGGVFIIQFPDLFSVAIQFLALLTVYSILKVFFVSSGARGTESVCWYFAKTAALCLTPPFSLTVTELS